MSSSTKSLPEAVAGVLGRSLAEFRREWQREAAVAAAESRAVLAEMKALAATLDREVREKAAVATLAEIDTMRAAVAGMITKAEAHIAALPVPKDGAPGERGLPGERGEPGPQGEAGPEGKAAELPDISGMVSEAVRTVVADLPPAKDGKDADPEVVAALVREGVSAAVAALPPAQPGKDGEPGKDIDPELVRTMVAESVEGAVAEIPKPERGEPGEKGADGKDGAVGETGPVGPAGPAGDAGGRGPIGERGPEGAPGKLPPVKAWTDEVHYDGAVVSHGGQTWQAMRDTGRAPPHEDWQCIASAGQDGVDGRSFVIRGTWKEGEDYQALDVVAVNGASFAARRDNPGACPGEGWQMIAGQGKRGNPGERGLQGPKGDRGPAGEPVVGLAVDGEGLLTLTNGDGSVERCDLYPVLAKVG